ncbi:hypothetical protein ACIPIX_03570 [Pseudomonas protegens]|uniref:hypothetical protein n=1 Tax=Pseudomonas protegens TaxID=380021 RepID=UPI00380232A2
MVAFTAHAADACSSIGRAASRIRSARQEGAYWLPPFFKQGNRICWRVSTVRRFLQECEEGKHVPARPGRKRQTPPTLARVG